MRARALLAMILAIFVGSALSAASPAQAFERVPYSNAVFSEARATNRPTIIFVHAVWCTTCQAQDRVLAQLVDDPRFANLLILHVDYDTQQHLMRFFNVPDRSTMVIFRNGTEVDRLYAQTSFAAIEAFLLAAVAAVQ